MPTECTASALAKAAACYGCLLPRQRRNALLSLLCQWANSGGAPHGCGTPSDYIQLTGAGINNANGWYVKQTNTYWIGPHYQFGPVRTTYWIEYRNGRWELWNAITPPFVPPEGLYWSSNAEFPCSWNPIVPAGIAPSPTGNYHDSFPTPMPAYFNVFDDGAGGFWMLVVDTLGNIGTQSVTGPASPDVILQDGLGSFWKIIVDAMGNRGTVPDAGPPTTAPFMNDENGAFWQIVVDTIGNLGTTPV